MNPFTGVVLFTMIWWTVLFMVLPFGIRPVPEGENPTGWRGTPERPQILRKILITTAISAALWGVAFMVIQSDWLSFPGVTTQL